eukprot:GHVS01107092.1.p1 GENE.GHVS01107092.1~~GHVS01107092.1.p1  ORF type:complete len:467 (+),score=88.93 GHVS01107092.1:119-1519(+)
MNASTSEKKRSGKEAEDAEEVKEVEEEVDEEEETSVSATCDVPAKKKKKKNRKKKSTEASDATTKASVVSSSSPLLQAQSNAALRRVGDWPETSSKQTCPPTIPIRSLYPPPACPSSASYPVGQLLTYKSSHVASKIHQEETREAFLEEELVRARLAAECHRQVRKDLQTWARPGISMLSLVQRLESTVASLIESNGLERGWGFPTGCSLNNCAAHYTPNYGEKEVILGQKDLCKLDFGVQVGGRIIDCAFTIGFDECYDSLIEATQEGTNTGIKEAGIDVVLGELGGKIQEVIESYEVEIENKTYKVKPIRNLNGHSIAPYTIHAGKSVPIVNSPDNRDRMEVGEFYAIETFASTGRGVVVEDMECSHYMKDADMTGFVPLRVKTARSLLHTIDKEFGGLAFCRRWLDDVGQKRHLVGLKCLVDEGLVNPYPPLCDVAGSYTSQMEHTIVLRPTCTEVLSRGDDF